MVELEYFSHQSVKECFDEVLIYLDAPAADIERKVVDEMMAFAEQQYWNRQMAMAMLGDRKALKEMTKMRGAFRRKLNRLLKKLSDTHEAKQT